MLEQGDVTISGEPHVFAAYADRSIRWNGWLACPHFDRYNANHIAAWINEENT